MGGIRIEGDGTTEGTNVIDTYTGEKLDNIISVDIHAGVDGVSATIQIIPSEIDIEVLDEKLTRKYN
jgi:hypothetical protein